MPDETSSSLEAKVNLLLALVVDERLAPDGEQRIVYELLRRAGIDLGLPAETQEALRFLQEFDEKGYFLTHRWVNRRLTQVTDQLNVLQQQFGAIATNTVQVTDSLTKSVDLLTAVEEKLGAATNATNAAAKESLESRKFLQDMANSYAELKVSTANIEGDLKSLSGRLKTTAKDVEEINNTLVKLQQQPARR